MVAWVVRVKTPILVTGTKLQVLLHNTRAQMLTRSRSSGFTLLELMVVVLIIALVMTTVTLNVRIGDGDAPIKRASDRMVLVLQMLSEEAVLLNTSLGVKFHTLGYDVYRLKYVELERDEQKYEYDEDGNLVEAPLDKDWRWIKLGQADKDSPLSHYILPEGLSFDVSIESSSIVLDEPDLDLEKEQAQDNLKENGTPIKPTLFITPDAEIFPDFSIKIINDENDTQWRSVQMDEEGELVIEHSPEE